MRTIRTTGLILVLLIGSAVAGNCLAQPSLGGRPGDDIDRTVRRLMVEGNIPGLSLVIIKGGQQIIRTYGYADLEKRTPVSPGTLFEMGSCSKAFTALAVLKLAKAGYIDLNACISDYLPWFRATYKDSAVRITILQLLHHTSGIRWQTIGDIPESNSKTALEETVRKVSGVRLKYLPGRRYEYATINYDILALVVQTVAHEPFETYLQAQVVAPLQLAETTIGVPADSGLKAKGYKIGFFHAIRYQAPVYKGNNAAGYVISNAEDISRWLRFQMGLGGSEMYDLARSTQQRDETVPLHGMDSYAMGWEVSLSGNKEIFHDGRNPNFTTYISFRPDKKTGVAVLANSNSDLTDMIGISVSRLLNNEQVPKKYDISNGNDRAYTVLCVIMCLFLMTCVAYLSVLLNAIWKGKRQFAGFSAKRIGKILVAILLLLPALYGLYMLPEAMAGFSWQAALVWTPQSFGAMVVSTLASMFMIFLICTAAILFPEQNRFRKIAPRILFMSIISGLANMAVIAIVTSAVDPQLRLRYLFFYYVLIMTVYLLGQRYAQINLIKFTREIIDDIRGRLIAKIFSTSYQRFERIDKGKIYTTLNDDVETVGRSADQITMLITNVFTSAGAFLYLASMAFWTAIILFALILAIASVYYLVSRSTVVYFEQARDIRNTFMSLINGIVDGYKEISMHRNKKMEYTADVEEVAREYKEKTATAGIRFVNAFLIGESMLVILLGGIVFAIPRLFPSVQTYVIMSFVIIVLYLIGPVNAILGAIPSVIQLKIAWKRIQRFLETIPANLDLKRMPVPLSEEVQSIKLEGVRFKYESNAGDPSFEIGPINLSVKKGEVLFIIGGNGSGKTTLAKLLIGLYEPLEGRVLINDKPLESLQLSECFSAVFSPVYLFEKLYGLDTEGKAEEIQKHLKRLHLEEKVRISDKRYSTIDLSGGQRKRLTLLQCYLEDSPIYLFDEWAADQDPEYRNFFYRILLPEMKTLGKIVIAITHDDNYFDVADRVLKMRQGKLEVYSEKIFSRPNHQIFQDEY
jgi:putative ATP-binding cassette transporter